MPEFLCTLEFLHSIITDYFSRTIRKCATMTTIKVGDRVCIRGLVQSDCLGLTGRVLEVRPSALFGRGIQRCKVDFNGKIRRLLSLHLARVGHSKAMPAA